MFHRDQSFAYNDSFLTLTSNIVSQLALLTMKSENSGCSDDYSSITRASSIVCGSTVSDSSSIWENSYSDVSDSTPLTPNDRKNIWAYGHNFTSKNFFPTSSPIFRHELSERPTVRLSAQFGDFSPPISSSSSPDSGFSVGSNRSDGQQQNGANVANYFTNGNGWQPKSDQQTLNRQSGNIQSNVLNLASSHLNEAPLFSKQIGATNFGAYNNSSTVLLAPIALPSKRQNNVVTVAHRAYDVDVDEEGIRSLVVRPKKTPPDDYICHICYGRGHYIRDCPRANMQDCDTPYQGPKKCFGFYKCSKCKRKWTSGNSFAQMPQDCKKCKIPAYAYKQMKLETAEKRNLFVPRTSNS